jgi:type IV secretory pathway VirB4 component
MSLISLIQSIPGLIGLLSFIILVTPKWSEMFLGRALSASLERDKAKYLAELERYKADLQGVIQAGNEKLKAEFAKEIEDYKANINDMQRQNQRYYEEESRRKSSRIKFLEDLVTAIDTLVPHLESNLIDTNRAANSFLDDYPLGRCHWFKSYDMCIKDIGNLIDHPRYWDKMRECPDQLSLLFQELKKEARNIIHTLQCEQ